MKKPVKIGIAVLVGLLGLAAAYGLDQARNRRALSFQRAELTEKELETLEGSVWKQAWSYQTDGTGAYVYVTLEQYEDGFLTTSLWGAPLTENKGRLLLGLTEKEAIASLPDGTTGCLEIQTVTEAEESWGAGILAQDQEEIAYNRKIPLAMIGYGGEDGHVSFPSYPVSYYDLPELAGESGKVTVVSAVFTDFEPSEGLVSYNWQVRDGSSLSQETKNWLEAYNRLPLSGQMALSSVPREFYEETGAQAMETEAMETEQP